MKKLISILLIVAMIAAFACGCGEKAPTGTTADDGTDLSYIKNKGTMIVGITDFEPMDYQIDGQWTGFDAELANKVGEKLGVTISFQEVNWETKETELASKAVDCIWNGLTWNEERAANMSMTDNYMLNRQVIVVKQEDTDKYTSIDLLRTANIAAESGSAGVDFINEKLGSAKLIEKDAQIDALTELLAGTVDACVLDYTMAYYLINKSGSSFGGLTILENVIQSEDEYYAVAFRKDSNVTAEVNKILADLKADGTVKTIAEKYGLADAIVK